VHPSFDLRRDVALSVVHRCGLSTEEACRVTLKLCRSSDTVIAAVASYAGEENKDAARAMLKKYFSSNSIYKY
jgi:hypothetical protein